MSHLAPPGPPLPYPHAPRVNPHAEEKIARVSGADLDLFEHSLTLEIRGTEDERNRAKKYVECVMAQRVGPVHIEEDDGEDLTTIMVPSEAVGFVTGSQAHTPLMFSLKIPPLPTHTTVHLAGVFSTAASALPRLPPCHAIPPARPPWLTSCLPASQGNFLRQVEEEWGTLMFFADYRSKDRGQSVTPACTHAWLRRSGTTPWATKPPSPRGPWPRAHCLATSSTRAE